MKSRWLAKIAAIVCALCLTTGVMSQTVFARDDSLSQDEYLAELPEATFVVLGESVSDKTGAPEVTDNRLSVPLYLDEEEAGFCSVVEGEPYVSVADFCAVLGLDVQMIDQGSALSMAMDGLMLTAHAGQTWFSCNERYLYAENGIRDIGGKLALPLESLVKCLGVTVSWDRVQWRVTVENSQPSPLKSGSAYYDETDLYWLSRFVYAMSGGQPLETQVAVASVCVNRLQSGAFSGQRNIYEVIFAKNQFDVVTNGMIYTTPDETSVLAAKLALEGCDLAKGASYVTSGDLGSGDECVVNLGGLKFFNRA